MYQDDFEDDYDDDHDEGYDDWEAPEPDDRSEEELELLPCPACGQEIYEEVEACPYCGEYVTHSMSALAGRPTWYVALAILGIVSVIGMIFYWVRFIPALR